MAPSSKTTPKAETTTRSAYVVAAENLGAALVALDEATQTFAEREFAYLAARDALDAAQTEAITANDEVQMLMSNLQPRAAASTTPAEQKPAHVLERDAHERRKADKVAPKVEVPEAPLASTTVAGPHPALPAESHEFSNWESAEPDLTSFDADGEAVASVVAEPDTFLDEVEPDNAPATRLVPEESVATSTPVDNDW